MARDAGCRLPGLEVTGLFQHFAVADESSADSVACYQPARALRPGLSGPCRASFEPAVVLRQLLGDAPPRLARRTAPHPLHGTPASSSGPTPAMKSWHLPPGDEAQTIVSMVKEMQTDQSVTDAASPREKPTKVATLCAGYADSYRLLSCGKGIVEIKVMPCPVLGPGLHGPDDGGCLGSARRAGRGQEAILWGGK